MVHKAGTLMAIRSNLQRRSTGYYYRVKVPVDLRDSIGKCEIVKSLATNNHLQARLRACEIELSVLQWFESLRNHAVEVYAPNKPISYKSFAMPTKTTCPTLPDLLEDWALHKHLTTQSARDQNDHYKEAKRVIDKFTELQSLRPIDSYKRDDLLALKAFYHKNALKPRTQKKYLGLLKTIITHGIKNELIETDPFPIGAYEIAARKGEDEDSKVRPYKTNELQKLFKAPLYTGMHSTHRPYTQGYVIEKNHRFWLPLISLFTGMRETEIIQLATDDIQSEDGIYHIRVTNDKAYQKLKTPKSKRLIPIHPELVRCGLMEYWNDIKQKKYAGITKHGSYMLFPEVKANNKEKRLAKSFSQFFGRFCNERGLNDPTTNFHSFRHTFKDACREAGIPRDLHDRLTGHTDASVSASYGKGFSVQQLAKELQKISYKEPTGKALNLSHLYTPKGLERWQELEKTYKKLGIIENPKTANTITVTKPNKSDYTVELVEAFERIGHAIYGKDWDKNSHCIGITNEPEMLTSRLIDKQWIDELRKPDPDWEVEEQLDEILRLESLYNISTAKQSEQFRKVISILFDALYQGKIGHLASNESNGYLGSLPDEELNKRILPPHYDLVDSTFRINRQDYPVSLNNESLEQFVDSLKDNKQ